MLTASFPTPILADADTIVGAIIVVFTIIGWLIKLVTSQTQKGPPVAQRPKPPARQREDRLQQEIEIFIQDAGTASRGAQRPAVQAPQRPALAAQQPTASPAPARRVVTAQRPPIPQQVVAQAGAALPQRPARRIRPGEDIAARSSPVSSDLGQALKQHLREHMAERVSSEVQQHLQHRVEESVKDHLGADAPGERQPPREREAGRPSPAARIAELLRDRSNMRQALVMNMILTRPQFKQGESRR